MTPVRERTYVRWSFRCRGHRPGVTAETFTTRWVFRPRTVPVSEAQDLSVRTIFRDPVYVRTGNGRKQRLHKVKPEHLADISALTGLPVRDWYHQ